MSDLIVLVIMIAVSCGAAAGLIALFARRLPAWRGKALILAALATRRLLAA